MKEHTAIVLRNSDGEVLFVKRSMKKKSLPGAWSFPSGTVEKGESAQETAKREAMEELGIGVKPEEPFAKMELPEFSTRLSFVNCLIEEGEPEINEPEEIDKMEWMSFDRFFERFSDDEIGHGLVWLRKNRHLL